MSTSMPVLGPGPVPLLVLVPVSTPIPESVMLLLSAPLAGEPEREAEFRSRRASLETTTVECQYLRTVRRGTWIRCRPAKMMRVCALRGSFGYLAVAFLLEWKRLAVDTVPSQALGLWRRLSRTPPGQGTERGIAEKGRAEERGYDISRW
ncbi:hypothetical protein F5Y14DRAFT_453377 [Nemania sp. NC0429]|nr:hypothetical protein F5Y14DRAFT_453377 [Nemania sp. NC0429]